MERNRVSRHDSPASNAIDGHNHPVSVALRRHPQRGRDGTMDRRLGIDIGGSAIKSGVVDLASGSGIVERLELRTPRPSTPEAVGERIREIASRLGADGPIGITYPGVVRGGVAETAANMDKGWIGYDGEGAFREATGRPVHFMNDADAAGLAEMRHGAGKGRNGTVIVATFGTGIGTAIFIDGRLLPNTEFGHVEVRGEEGEHRAAASVKSQRGWGWEEWAQAVDEYLHTLERLFSPDRFIIGGAISRESDHFLPLLTVRAEVVPAALGNDAGVVGAVIAAAERFG